MEQTKKISAFRLFRGDFAPTAVYYPRYLVDSLTYLHSELIAFNLYHKNEEEFFTKLLMIGAETVLTDFSKLIHSPTEHEILALGFYSLKQEIEEKIEEQKEKKLLE